MKEVMLHKSAPTRKQGYIRQIFPIIGLILSLLIIFTGLFTDWFISRSLPQTSGTLNVAGLQQRVEVGRDTWGTPYIQAGNMHDLLFAQGYVTAQDRLFQMEVDRSVVRGQLAALFGAGPDNEVLDSDILVRTLGIYQTIQQRLKNLDPQTKAELQAYTDGVNTFIETHKQNLPLEFSLLGITPAPWTIADGVATTALIALALDTSWYWKYTHALVEQKAGTTITNDLFPSYPEQNPILLSSTVSTKTSTQAKTTAIAANKVALLPTTISRGTTFLQTLLGNVSGTLGSNSWVVNGDRSSSGEPLLANDPHLSSSQPSTWYEIALRSNNFNVIGFSLPGTPGIVIGHNNKIAWGITSAEADSSDLYQETLSTQHPGEYLYNGHWLPLQTHTEIINVHGSNPVTITVNDTRNGPLLNYAINDLKNSQPIALKWTLLQPEYQIADFIQLDAAQNWSDFQAALAHISLCQNFIYADTQGNIGYRMSGLLPIRPEANELLIVDGSTSAYDWQGYVSASQMPTLYDPSNHIIVVANNRIVPLNSSIYVSSFSDYGYRAQHITDLINQMKTLTIASDEKIQSDTYTLPASLIIPYLLTAASTSHDPLVQQALHFLQGWDDAMTNTSIAASIYEMTTSTLIRQTIEPLLGKNLYSIYENNFSDSGLITALINQLKQPTASFFGTQNTQEAVQKRDTMLISALHITIQQLQTQYGQDTSQWEWGKIHTVTFSHPLADIFPLNYLFSIPTLDRPGDTETINMGGDDNFAADPPDYQQYTVSSMREIIDCGNYNNSLWILPTGESGQPFSTHYDDLSSLWNEQHYQQMILPGSTKQSFSDMLILQPAATK